MDQNSRLLIVGVTLFLVAGCGGLDIRPGVVGSDGGYQLYYPKTVVTVSTVWRCVKPESGGACPSGEWQSSCVVGSTWLLPDFSKPYVARFKPGIGSAQATLDVSNGWLLSKATSQTNVSSLSEAVLETLGVGAEGLTGCKEGIYEWTESGFRQISFPGG